MNKCLCLLFLISLTVSLHAQENRQRLWEAGADAGAVKYSLNDKLLNYYQYDAVTPSLYHLHFNFQGENNLHFFSIYYRSKTLSESGEPGSYAFNALKLYDAEFRYEYFHKLQRSGTRPGFFIGAAYDLYITSMNETYTSSYWPYETGQNSHDFSGVFLVTALLNYPVGRWNLAANASYGVLNVAGRPDDFFVKYGERYKSLLKVYTPMNYQNVQFSLRSHFDISARFSLQLEYRSEYRSYTGDYGMKFLKQFWLCGISYKL